MLGNTLKTILTGVAGGSGGLDFLERTTMFENAEMPDYE